MYLDIEKIDGIENPDDLVKELKKWDELDTSRYTQLHDEWERNVLFYLGKQWLEKKKGVSGYEIYEDEDEHFRPVTNYIKRNCELKRSQILGRKVHSIIRPNSDNKDDYDSSRLGYLALKAKHILDGEDEYQRLAFIHGEVFGTAYRSDYKRVIPDKTLSIPKEKEVRTEFFACESCGNIQSDSSTCQQCGNPEMTYKRDIQHEIATDMDGNQIVDEIPIYENAINIIDPFRMKMSPCMNMKDMRWIQEKSIQPLEWVKANFKSNAEGYYPENAQAVKKRDKLPRELKLSCEFQVATSSYHSSISKGVNRADPDEEFEEASVILRKLYICPTSKRPKGRLLMYTCDQILYDGDPDLPASINKNKVTRWHTYSIFRYGMHPIRYEGVPYIEDQIPLNIKINALDSMILEWLDKTALPERVEYANVGMNDDDGTDGNIKLDGRPDLPNGGAPFYLQRPQLSSEVYKMREFYVAEIEKIGNVTEVIQGLRPAGVDTYRGLQLLRDAAQSSESELYNRWYDFIRESAQLKLALIQECLLSDNEDLTSMMDTIRKNENMCLASVKSFSGEDLRNNLNIVIEEIDYEMQSKAAELDRLRGAIDGKLITPEDLGDPIVKHSLIQKMGLGTMTLNSFADIEKTQRMIQYIKRGDFQRVQGMLKHFDNLKIQQRIISTWVKGAEYEELDQQIQQFTESVVLKTIEDKLREAQAAQAAQAAQGPPHPPRGQPPAPQGARPPVGGPPLPPRGAPQPQPPR